MMCKYSTIFTFLFALTIAANAQQVGIADSLYGAGEYEAAAVEYERCYYLATSRADKHSALVHKAQCYKQTGNFGKAATTIKRYATTYADNLQLALCHFLNSDFGDAASAIATCEAMSDSISNDLLLIKVLTLNELSLYDSAYRVALCLAARKEKSTGHDMSLLVDSLYAEKPKLKSEQLAQYLSFLPGLGHIYANQWGLGAIDFAINAALISFGIWQVYERCYLTAWIGGAGLFSATYRGSMRSATQYVRKYNYQRCTAFNKSTRQTLLTTFEP